MKLLGEYIIVDEDGDAEEGTIYQGNNGVLYLVIIGGYEDDCAPEIDCSIYDNLGSFKDSTDWVYTKKECIPFIKQKLTEAESQHLNLFNFQKTQWYNSLMESAWNRCDLGEYKPHPLYDIAVLLQEKEEKLYKLCIPLIHDIFDDVKRTYLCGNDLTSEASLLQNICLKGQKLTIYEIRDNIHMKMKYKIYYLHMELLRTVHERKFRPGNEGYMDALNDFAK